MFGHTLLTKSGSAIQFRTAELAVHIKQMLVQINPPSMWQVPRNQAREHNRQVIQIRDIQIAVTVDPLDVRSVVSDRGSEDLNAAP